MCSKLSFIQRELKQENGNTSIKKFLLEEGFEFGSGAQGEGTMYYVAIGSLYSVWFALCEDHFSLYAEYECGGRVGGAKIQFEENNFSSFLKAYRSSIEWAKEYIK